MDARLTEEVLELLKKAESKAIQCRDISSRISAQQSTLNEILGSLDNESAKVISKHMGLDCCIATISHNVGSLYSDIAMIRYRVENMK